MVTIRSLANSVLQNIKMLYSVAALKVTTRSVGRSVLYSFSANNVHLIVVIIMCMVMYYLAVTKCCLHLVVIALCMKIAVAAKSNV